MSATGCIKIVVFSTSIHELPRPGKQGGCTDYQAKYGKPFRYSQNIELQPNKRPS